MFWNIQKSMSDALFLWNGRERQSKRDHVLIAFIQPTKIVCDLQHHKKKKKKKTDSNFHGLWQYGNHKSLSVLVIHIFCISNWDEHFISQFKFDVSIPMGTTCLFGYINKPWNMNRTMEEIYFFYFFVKFYSIEYNAFFLKIWHILWIPFTTVQRA